MARSLSHHFKTSFGVDVIDHFHRHCDGTKMESFLTVCTYQMITWAARKVEQAPTICVANMIDEPREALHVSIRANRSRQVNIWRRRRRRTPRLSPPLFPHHEIWLKNHGISSAVNHLICRLASPIMWSLSWNEPKEILSMILPA